MAAQRIHSAYSLAALVYVLYLANVTARGAVAGVDGGMTAIYEGSSLAPRHAWLFYMQRDMPSIGVPTTRRRTPHGGADSSRSSSILSRRTFTDQVAEAILELIRDRGLRDGDTLPPAAGMAERFGVSRPVLREALADLAGRGLSERQQG